jgi:integrase
MAGKRKPPRLREKQGCFVTDIYTPAGTRTTVSFGPAGTRTEGEIYTAFGKWLDLFQQHPDKILSFKSPYEAIRQMVNPATILTVGEFVDKYAEWAKSYLTPMRDGRAHPDLMRVDRLKRFLDPYLRWPVGDFGPDELRAVQDAMVAHRYFRKNHEEEPLAYTRTGINQVINQIYKIWQWGIGREVTTEAQRQRLKEVRPLRSGRTVARDKPKRRPVTQDELNKVADQLTSVVSDMLRLIWLTAIRPGEVRRMRPYDVIRERAECWLYVPGRDVGPVGDHKTAYRQRVRVIPLAGRAQAILGPRISDFDSKAFIFAPAEAMAESRERRFANRNTPMDQGNRAGTNRQEHPMIKPGEAYTATSFYSAVRRACRRAAVEPFSPYDLRRSAATRVRAALSKEDARLLLGHASSDTTQIYLLEEVKESIKVAKRLEAAEQR